MITLTPDQLEFVTVRHLATLTTVRADGSPHVVPVAFTWDADRGCARITTRDTSVKARLAERGGADGAPLRVALCQFEGQRWLTLEGTVTMSRDPAQIAEAVDRYADRYRRLEAQPQRVVLHVAVERVMGTVR
ncbi:MAG: pyridoxamine 5'-phosphate oxidase family protein [Cellulomonas sp.]